MSNPAQNLAGHLLTQTVASINLLEQLSIISAQDAGMIRSKLPPANGPFPSLEPQQQIQRSQSFQYGHPPPSLPPRGSKPVSETRGRALWDYNGTEADDLAFRAGDTIIIDEEVNEQWYRGRAIPQGQTYPIERQGLFPSNYIEKIQPQSPTYHQPPNSMVQYQSPPPPVHYQSPPQPYYQNQMYQPQQGQVQIQEEKKQGRFGKIGGQVGNAAASGFGFGAGAAVGSSIVNAII